VPGLLALLLACSPAPRARLGEAVSPDGRYVAVLYREPMGPAAGDRVVVELWPTRGIRWPWAGRVFSAATLPRAARRAGAAPSPPPPNPLVTWRSATELEVLYFGAVRVGVRKLRVGPVHLTYPACPEPAAAPAGGDPAFTRQCT
jgi:hypothetical protein